MAVCFLCIYQPLCVSCVVKYLLICTIQGITMKASLEIPNMLLNSVPKGFLKCLSFSWYLVASFSESFFQGRLPLRTQETISVRQRRSPLSEWQEHYLANQKRFVWYNLTVWPTVDRLWCIQPVHWTQIMYGLFNILTFSAFK